MNVIFGSEANSTYPAFNQNFNDLLIAGYTWLYHPGILKRDRYSVVRISTPQFHFSDLTELVPPMDSLCRYRSTLTLMGLLCVRHIFVNERCMVMLWTK